MQRMSLFPCLYFSIIFDFQVFIVIFNQNLEISDECDFLSFYFENSVFKVTMEDITTKIAVAIVYTEC